jgi:molybdenum cofactor cytidylyltransferase
MNAAGLILAAGAGTRFGPQTKQLAELRGKPLLQHAVDAMNAALERAVVVLGHDADAIRAAVDFGPAQVVLCEDWAQGQGLSLRAGVAALAGAEAVAITLGDQPFITAAVITAALAELGDFDALRAVYDGTPGHPVVLSRRVLDAVPELEGDAGARELLARFRVRRWEASHLASGTDVDTREELSRL